jgi:ribosome-associated protein
MTPAIRQYYNLEEIWGGRPVNVKLLPQSTQPSMPESFDYNEDE